MKTYIYILAFMYFTPCMGKPLVSGYYGDNLLVLNENGHVYGQYEYYEKWNSDVNNFGNVCKFYFYGITKTSDTIQIKIGLPGVGVNNGIMIQKGDSIRILSNYNCGYSTSDFRSDGLCCIFRKTEKGVALGIIKSAKAYFYDQPNDSTKTKSYIVNSDFVRIIEKNETWSKIEYISIFDGRKTIKWIKSSSLYDLNPDAWGN